MRINKYLASCGIASRRAAEQLVLDGRVRVNGNIVTSLSFIVQEHDVVKVDNMSVVLDNEYIYLVMHKPKGVITTTKDEKGRKTVLDILDSRYKDKRIFPIGRLDYDTEGLLLLTTDGELANRLTHPAHEITKTYVAKIEGQVDDGFLRSLRDGVEIDGVRTKKCRAKLIEYKNGFSKIEVVISEGRNRQVRKMFEALGKEIKLLKRTAIGDFYLRGLKRGESRSLSQAEIDYLKNM